HLVRKAERQRPLLPDRLEEGGVEDGRVPRRRGPQGVGDGRPEPRRLHPEQHFDPLRGGPRRAGADRRLRGPRMTALVLLLAALQPTEIRAVQETPKLIRVTSPSRFETTFTTRKGFGAAWFDLKHDPDRKRDLAPVLDENGFFWIKIGQPEGDGSWYANPAEEMSLLETGPVRVRIRLRGAHMRYGQTEAKAAWKELRF